MKEIAERIITNVKMFIDTTETSVAKFGYTEYLDIINNTLNHSVYVTNQATEYLQFGGNNIEDLKTFFGVIENYINAMDSYVKNLEPISYINVPLIDFLLDNDPSKYYIEIVKYLEWLEYEYYSIKEILNKAV